MTEKNEKPQQQATAPGRDNREAIPVRELRFVSPTDIPGKSVADGVKATQRDAVFNAKGERTNNQKAWFIEYRPWMRHHVITFFPPGTNTSPEFWFVHEANVKGWAPAAA